MLTEETPETLQRRRSGVYIINFKRIVHLFLSVSIVDFEQVNSRWNSLSEIFHKMVAYFSFYLHTCFLFCKRNIANSFSYIEFMKLEL